MNTRSLRNPRTLPRNEFGFVDSPLLFNEHYHPSLDWVLNNARLEEIKKFVADNVPTHVDRCYSLFRIRKAGYTKQEFEALLRQLVHRSAESSPRTPVSALFLRRQQPRLTGGKRTALMG